MHCSKRIVQPSDRGVLRSVVDLVMIQKNTMSRRNGLAHALRRVYFSTIAGIHRRGRTGKGLWKIGREIIWIRLVLPYLIDFIGRLFGSTYLTESLCFRNVRLH